MKNRREFLRDGLRWGGLLAVGGTAAWLGVRSMRGDCTRHDPCGACPLYTGCGLPKAAAAKSATPPDPSSGGTHPRSQSDA